MDSHIESSSDCELTSACNDLHQPLDLGAGGAKTSWRTRASAMKLMAVSLAACLAMAVYSARLNSQTKAGVDAFEEKWSMGTSYIYEGGSQWKDKPDVASVPRCKLDSGKTLCKCSNDAKSNNCDINALDAATPATGRCSSKINYVYKGKVHRNEGKHAVDIEGKNEEVYCKQMVKNDKWHQKHITRRASDEATVSSSGWFGCRGSYTWHQGKCRLKTRYLGETCWDGSSIDPRGSCQSGDDEYKVSCYKGKCTPRTQARERHQCSCAWVGWNFIVACSASGDKCGGHACVLSTGDGNKYCDYSSDQNW